MNEQPNKHFTYFQKIVVQNLFIKQLNKWIDELEWENEKKDTIIEMRDAEINELNTKLQKSARELEKVNHEFKMFIKKHKDSKRDEEKERKQQEIIDQLKEELRSTTARLQTRDRMVKLLEKQIQGK